MPIALGALALLGVAGTVAGFGASASRNSELTRANGNLAADLDDADAEILRLEAQLDEAASQITELEGDLTDSSATVLTLQRDLATARAELDAAHASPDLSAIDELPSLNDGVVSAAEAAMIAEQAESFGLEGAVLDAGQYQQIADRACAADTMVDLNGVVGWMRMEHPQLTLDGAGFLAGGTGSAACQGHIYELLGV